MKSVILSRSVAKAKNLALPLIEHEILRSMAYAETRLSLRGGCAKAARHSGRATRDPESRKKRLVSHLRGNEGNLIGLRGASQLERSFSERRGLTPAPRVAIYRGFIFASLSPEGETLKEHFRKTQFPIDSEGS